jgi:hypothetical protein
MSPFIELIRNKSPYPERLSIITNLNNTVAVQEKLLSFGYHWTSDDIRPTYINLGLYPNGDLTHEASHYEDGTSIDGDAFLRLFKPLQLQRRHHASKTTTT